MLILTLWKQIAGMRQAVVSRQRLSLVYLEVVAISP